MKVILTDESIVCNPKVLTTLLQKRIILIWNYKISNIVQDVIFKSISMPYEIIPNRITYTIHFSNKVLLGLVHSGKGISDFDKYLMEIENQLIWKL